MVGCPIRREWTEPSKIDFRYQGPEAHVFKLRVKVFSRTRTRTPAPAPAPAPAPGRARTHG